MAEVTLSLSDGRGLVFRDATNDPAVFGKQLFCLVARDSLFLHEGVLPAHASYGEVKRAYQCGKEIMDCLYSCMSDMDGNPYAKKDADAAQNVCSARLSDMMLTPLRMPALRDYTI